MSHTIAINPFEAFSKGIERLQRRNERVAVAAEVAAAAPTARGARADQIFWVSRVAMRSLLASSQVAKRTSLLASCA